MKLVQTLMGAAAAVSMSSMAFAAGHSPANPALIFDLGGKFDKSFNESSYNGAERFREETRH